MLKTDRDALTCDLAETYQIYDMHAYPVRLISVFAVGLGDDSRIKRRLSGAPCSFDTLLRAAILDGINLLIWSRTKDAETGKGRPLSMVIKLMGEKAADTEPEISAFDSIEAFEAAKLDIISHAERRLDG